MSDPAPQRADADEPVPGPPVAAVFSAAAGDRSMCERCGKPKGAHEPLGDCPP